MTIKPYYIIPRKIPPFDSKLDISSNSTRIYYTREIFLWAVANVFRYFDIILNQKS